MLDKSEFKFIFVSLFYLGFLALGFPPMLFKKSSALPFLAIVMAISGLVLCWKLLMEIKK